MILVIQIDISELIRKEGLRRGLSHKTIRTYRQCVRKFFNWCRKEPHEIKKADIKSYLDLMIEKGYGWVRHGKGNKDRMFVIAESIKEELASHISRECASSDSYIFRGFSGHLTTASVRSIIKNAVKNSKISKHAHPHTLRHSFSTHLIENGSSVAEVQSLLGHSSAETTMVYLHIASPKMIGTKSPIDSLPIP